MTPRAAALASLLVAVGVTAAVVAGMLAGAVSGLGPVGIALATMVPIALLGARRAPEGIAAFGVVVLLAESVIHWTGGLDLRYLDEVGLPLLGATLVATHRHRILVPPIGVPELGLALLVGAGIASSLVNGVPAATWLTGLVLLVKAIAFFYLVLALRFDTDELRRICVPILVVTVAIGVVGLLQFVAPEWTEDTFRLPASGGRRGGLDVVSSVFTHPALFGWITAFLGLFLYARFAVLRDRWALVGALVANAGTLLSGRRSPFIGIVVGLGVGAARLLTTGRRPERAWAVVAAGVLVVLLASVPVLGEFYARTLEAYGARPEAMAEVFADEPQPPVVAELHPRVALYVGSIAIALDEQPFGVGLGRFGSHLSREDYSPVYEEYGLHRTYGLRPGDPRAVTDTFWPMLLGEAGLLGLAGALLFYGGVGLRLWSAARRETSPGARAFVLGALLVFTEAVVRSGISQAFIAPPVAYFVLGAAALALGLGDEAGLPDGTQTEYSGASGTPLATPSGEPPRTRPSTSGTLSG